MPLFFNEPVREFEITADLAALLGDDFAARYDTFDFVQLAYVIGVGHKSASAAEAAKKTVNDTNRLSKYLARFRLKFRN